MKDSGSRLYSGPLSQAAQKILAVLRAQSQHAASSNDSSSHRQMERCYGGHREDQSSVSTSYERSLVSSFPTSYHDTSSQTQSSQASACYQYSQTPDCSPSSQDASSSCWDPSFQSQRCQAEAYYRHAETYSQLPARQLRRARSVAQREASEAAAPFTHRDGYTLSLQTPETLFQYRHSPQRGSCNSPEEMRSRFIFNFSQGDQGQEEVFDPIAEQPKTRGNEPGYARHPFSPDGETRNASGAQEQLWYETKGAASQNVCRNEVDDSLASGSQPQWKKPLVNHAADVDVGGRLRQKSKLETITFGNVPFVPSGYVTRQERNCDTRDPQAIRAMGEDDRLRQAVDVENMTRAGTDQMLHSECKFQAGMKGVTWHERGQRDSNLKEEKRFGREQEGSVRLERTENARLQRASNTGRRFGCDADGNEQKEDNYLETTADASEVKVLELDNKAPTLACSSSPERSDHKVSVCQPENPQDTSQAATEPGEVSHGPDQSVRGGTPAANPEMMMMVQRRVGAETTGRCSDVQGHSQCETGKSKNNETYGKDDGLEEKWTGEDPATLTEDSGGEKHLVETCQESERRRSALRTPCPLQKRKGHNSIQPVNRSTSGSSSSTELTPGSVLTSGQSSSLKLDLSSGVIAPRLRLEKMNLSPSQTSVTRLLIPSFSLKRKREALHFPNDLPKIDLKRRPKWEPPHSSKESEEGEGRVGEQTWRKMEPALKKERYEETDRRASGQTPTSVCCKRSKHKRAKCEPHQATTKTKTFHEGAGETKRKSKPACLTANLTSDPRVKNSGKLNDDEKMQVLDKAGQAKVLVMTMVYQDGTTQLDPEQKLTPPACGLLILIKNELDQSPPEDSLRPNDSLVYLELEQHTQCSQELFTRDMLLQALSGSQLVVCYKAKDLLRTVLKFYGRELSWKRVTSCHVQDPQVSGWLLDPADPSSCYQDLVKKHCKRPCKTYAVGGKKVSQAILGLSLLHWLNMELCTKLQSQGLWELYSHMEMKMIPVLAAMESHCICVDKEALRRTSDLLGTKMKQLEEDAHQAAGQIFLITSNAQLRTVLFEKLRLHEHCENKKLPKTINRQQQSTSEAALLQLQDLHPLPKIILEYRQVHKIKSTFVDGILSCMSENYISSTWCQTSVVTGRISAKHPNFQALPRQPVQITKRHSTQGKEEEVLTVHPRAMFVPHEGWTFVAADFCQVELRLLAHLSSDPELLRIFTNPETDVFTMLASQWKGMSEDDVTLEDREHAKRVVYSVVYGAGRERLSGILGVSTEQASRFQDSFLQTYRQVQTFIQRTIQLCHKQGYVLSIMGRRRTLANINSPNWGVRMQAERQAVNFVVQGSAADLCKMAMINIFKQISSSTLLSARLIAQLHDELLYEVEDSQVEQFAALVRTTMESLQHIDSLGVHLKVPLKVAVSSGKSWGSMSELNIPPPPPPPSLPSL